jgi:superfamily II DNA or RNA helicase
MTLPIKATFATNREDRGETVADAIRGHLDWIGDTWKKPFTVAIATAYINPGGFGVIEDGLHRAQSIRVLVGAEPQPPVARIRCLDDNDDDANRALEGHERTLEEDRNLMGFTQEADSSTRRFVDWLRSGVVEVRRFEKGFLHGKAYLVDTDDEGVIAGSSNFTYAGLARNHELNLGHYQPETVKMVREWFDDMWDMSNPYDLGAVFEARFLPHTPYLIYLRMLWEKYGADVEALARHDPFGLHLAPFQRDGVTLSRMILTRYNGVVIADGVGLGKTFVAGELIREAVEDRRQRVLVVAPAALRDGPWASFLHRQLFNFELVSYDELSMDRQLNPDHPYAKPVLNHPVNEYAMVVVDEAHAYRSSTTQRAEVLSRLLEGSPSKSLVMLTATPVNNSLWDLYNLLAYFVRNDAEFVTAGIPSLRERFKQASQTDPDALDPEQLFDVLSPVVVRRTRSYVKHYYPEAELEIRGVRRRVSFPRPEVRAITYDLAAVLPGFLERFAAALDVPDDGLGGAIVVLSASQRREAGEEALTLARYAPSAYKLGADEFEAYEGQVAGLLRSGLLKRFESSSHAFANTCQTMAGSHDQFLGLLDQDIVATGAALRELSASDSDDLDELLTEHGDEWNWAPASEYNIVRLRADVEADRDLLLAWAAEARTVVPPPPTPVAADGHPHDDPKLVALAEELAVILAEAAADVGETSTERDRRKVIVFSYYADTVAWVDAWLRHAVAADPRLVAYKDRVVAVSGSDRETEQQRALYGFAPVTTEAPPGQKDEFDILVSTDVLAEGVNLQQARHIINYDLPWNPMRLVQRHGRIDRIGSPHTRVWMRCFMPDRQIEQLLGLETRLHRKIKQAARSIGIESTIIPGSEISDRSYTDTREAIEEIRRGETGFLDETQAGMSVEEYRQQLREGLENPFLAEQTKRLAWGSGSGKTVAGAEPGFVFCAKVGDNPDPQFRYVNMAAPAEPLVVPDVLACFKHAFATPQTERVLDGETYRLAYDAWAAAKANIYEAWMWATDPRNLQPEVPRVMRDAAELIRTDPPAGMDQAVVDRLYDTLNAPYAERVRKQVRAALINARDNQSKVAALIDVVERLALVPPPEPKPLPLIEDEDINLVCWMAIVPPITIAEQFGELPLGDKL